MRHVALGLLSALLAALPAAAITPYPVTDGDSIPLSIGSDPTGFASVGGRAIFGTRSSGEVWTTDGTATGTVRIAVEPDATPVANTGTVIYFTTAEFNEHGSQGSLWVTDGTVAGTATVLGDLPQEAFGLAFTPVAGTRRVFFSFDDGIHGRELWTSNGSPAGTRQILDLRPGANGGITTNAAPFAMFRGRVYFSGDDGGGPALWASDGTAAGTEKLASFDVPGLFSLGPFRFAVLGDRLVFFADTPASGIEPWATDGTAAGTVQLAEVGAGPISLINVSKVHVAGSLGYFATRTENGEANLWRTDGTPGGTFPLTDFPGTEPFGRFSDLSIGTVGSKVAFAANDGVHGFEPWSTDGTLAGTRLIKDVCPGSCSGVTGAFAAQGARLYFAGTTSSVVGRNVEPWVSNLTAAGTTRLRDVCPGICSSRPVGFVAAGPFVYLTAVDAAGRRELWRTNGRTSGTVRLTHVVAPGAFTSESFEALALGNALLFSGTDPVHGQELWASNGLRGGTHLVVDLLGDP